MTQPFRTDRPSALRTDDLALVRETLEGQTEAVDRFVERMRCVPRILAAKNGELGRPLSNHELEDLAQDTLIILWRKLADYSGRASLETWVYHIGYLELMNRLRRLRRLPGLLGDFGGSQREPAVHDGPAPLEFEELHRGIEQLDGRSAEILRLKHFEDLTFDAIGELLELSANTVKTRYYRSLKKLRQLLAESQPERTEQNL